MQRGLGIAAFIGSSLLLASGLGARSEEGPGVHWLFNPTQAAAMRGMDTDRPNKTNTPHTVDAGHAQLELGFFDHVYRRDQEEGIDQTSNALALGRVNLRLGLSDDLELNLAFDSYDLLWNRDHLARQSLRASGFGDTVLGGKLALWGNGGSDEAWATGLAIQPQLKLPTARRDIGNGHVEFFLGFPFLIALPGDLHLALQSTVSHERNSANTGAAAGWQNSASLDRVFWGFDLYLEYWSHVSTERHRQAQQTIDVGFVYPLTENMTLDLGAAFGLNKSSNTAEWLAGMSVRF